MSARSFRSRISRHAAGHPTRVLLLFLLFAIGSMAVRPVYARVEKTVPLTIETKSGSHRFQVEEAVTAKEREYGLMDRKAMPRNRGMIFRFDSDQPVSMWMKDTLIPLDMVFILSDGTIAGIRANAVPMSEEIIPSPGPVRFVLELNGGTAARIGAEPGDKVRTRLINTTAAR